MRCTDSNFVEAWIFSAFVLQLLKLIPPARIISLLYFCTRSPIQFISLKIENKIDCLKRNINYLYIILFSLQLIDQE